MSLRQLQWKLFDMAPSQAVQKWLTLIGHCFASFSNAIGFGIYFTNLDVFSLYYNVYPQTIVSTFYIGLIFEIIFCVPALKLIQWRLDYSIMCAAFLTMAGYWMKFIAQSNFFVVICCIALESFGQAVLLPMSPYLAEQWFPLHQRSLAISLSFYSNLLGFAFGAIFTTIFTTVRQNVMKEMLIIAIISTFCLVISIATVKNKPKIPIEKYKSISLKQIKQLWKHKYNTYLIVMSSVFLGLSWSFLAQLSNLTQFVSSVELGVIMIVWVASGSIFGMVMSGITTDWVGKTGTFKFYDTTAKITLFIGLVGYVLMGICVYFQVTSLVGYILLVIFIGIGSIGFYGLMFMSLIETFYPLSSLLIGNIIVVGASLYSALAFAIDQYTDFNSFYVLTAVGFLPFIYVCLIYETNFKRYKYYLQEKKKQWVLLKVEDGGRSYFNDRKYE